MFARVANLAAMPPCVGLTGRRESSRVTHPQSAMEHVICDSAGGVDLASVLSLTPPPVKCSSGSVAPTDSRHACSVVCRENIFGAYFETSGHNILALLHELGGSSVSRPHWCTGFENLTYGPKSRPRSRVPSVSPSYFFGNPQKKFRDSRQMTPRYPKAGRGDLVRAPETDPSLRRVPGELAVSGLPRVVDWPPNRSLPTPLGMGCWK